MINWFCDYNMAKLYVSFANLRKGKLFTLTRAVK